ncbi:hypothetical protein BJ944DRAFT_109754 [Cunninghamella echinulata]|nr:hypothetical protein BJ944DRAFT_109754 [Cunninghamella echinulata]
MSIYTGSPEFTYGSQPEAGELISQMIGLSSITIISVLFGIKTYNTQYFYLSYSKWLVILLYICSWSFTFSGLHLVLTNNGNYTSCLLSILACDIFYSGTKIIIYCWLIEKVWVVDAGRTPRWQTKSYRFHILLLTPYIGIFVVMIIYHNAWLEKDGICIIGLKLEATVPLLLYDFFINLYMTILFVRPLFKIDKTSHSDQQTSRLKEVAKRTMVASVVCLLVSFANVAALTILKGVERGAVCLTCCYIDIMLNVITVHWVTSQPSANKTTQGPLSRLTNSNNKNNNNNTSSSNQTQTIGSTDTKKKKNMKHDSMNEQYGEFGDNHYHLWPAHIDHYQQKQLPSSAYYMSATNTNIITSPANIQDTSLNYPNMVDMSQPNYHPATNNNNNNNNHGRYIIVSEKEDDEMKDSLSRSRSSSIQESYSSRQSLTKTNLN